MDAQFNILSWAFWQADSLHPQPELPEIPAMQRRRFSRLSKMTLRAALDLDFSLRSLPSVFASRHGELHRTAELLLLLQEQEALSPTRFSQSVYNTASGLFSINQGNTFPSTVVTCGRCTLPMAFVEAYSQSCSLKSPILLVYADEPLPELYQVYSDEEQSAIAFACVIDAASSGWSFQQRLKTNVVNTHSDLATQLVQGLSSSQATFVCQSSDFDWSWSHS